MLENIQPINMELQMSENIEQKIPVWFDDKDIDLMKQELEDIGLEIDKEKLLTEALTDPVYATRVYLKCRNILIYKLPSIEKEDLRNKIIAFLKYHERYDRLNECLVEHDRMSYHKFSFEFEIGNIIKENKEDIFGLINLAFILVEDE